MSKNTLNPTLPSSKGALTKQNPRFGKSKSATESKNLKMQSGFLKGLTKKTSHRSFRTQSKDTNRKKVSFGEESVISRASFMDSVSRIGGSLLIKTQSMLSISNMKAKMKGNELFMKYATNKWRAETSAIFKCEDDIDNVPTQMEWRGFSFCVSQNKMEGKKEEGQDCIGVALHKNWEVFVVCDGHDQDGHLVSQGICSTLPHYLLRRVFASDRVNVDKMVDESMFIEAFAEAEETICWATELELEQGDCIKLLSGEFVGEVGYIAQVHDEEDDDYNEEGDVMLTVVIDNEKTGYQRFEICETEVVTPRYKGGSTCLCLLRNHKTNRCKVAVLGDSRLMVLGEIGQKFKADDFIDPVLMTTYIEEEEDKESVGDGLLDFDDKNSNEDTIGYFTPQHNVFNAAERTRIKDYQMQMKGEYVVNLEEGYLVNPETKMQIQPTRGFGDVEMQSVGYSHIPEVSSSFVLSPKSIMVGASDGIFDGEIWENDEKFLKFVDQEQKKNANSIALASSIFDETTKRCGDYSKLDDISIFTFVSPSGKRNYKKKPRKITGKKSLENKLDKLRSAYTSRRMKLRRTTIMRADVPGAHLYRKFFKRRSIKIVHADEDRI